MCTVSCVVLSVGFVGDVGPLEILVAKYMSFVRTLWIIEDFSNITCFLLLCVDLLRISLSAGSRRAVSLQ